MLFEDLEVGQNFVFEYEWRWYNTELLPKKIAYKNKHMPIFYCFVKTGKNSYESDLVKTIFDNRINNGSKLPKVRGYTIPRAEVYVLDEFLQQEICRLRQK